MRRYRKHRHARTVTIEQAIDKVKVAGSATARTHGEFAGQMRLGTGGEGRDFLVSDMNLVDLAVPTDGVCQTVETVPDNAVDALDARGRKSFDELIGNSFAWHLCLLEVH
ncbi:hypothetical protein ACVWYH_003350 [Bradyrhizobium sp. GM24.11]